MISVDKNATSNKSVMQPPSIDWVLVRFPGVALRCLIGLKLFQTLQPGTETLFYHPLPHLGSLQSNGQSWASLWFQEHCRSSAKYLREGNVLRSRGLSGALLCHGSSVWNYLTVTLHLASACVILWWKRCPFYPHQVKIKGGNSGNLRQKDAVLRNAGSVEPWELQSESFFANHSLLPQPSMRSVMKTSFDWRTYLSTYWTIGRPTFSKPSLR